MELPCMTSGCSKSVIYVPVKVYGIVGKLDQRLLRTDPAATKTVYLTCPLGHTNPYKVPAGS